VLKKYWNQYIRQDGKVVKGLINRRRDEWEMFIDGDYNRNY
jgi:GH24 family phage-related lysozyme (muramidase)